MAAYSPRVRLGSQSSAELTVALLRSVVEVYRVGLIKDGGPLATCSPRLPQFCRPQPGHRVEGPGTQFIVKNTDSNGKEHGSTKITIRIKGLVSLDE
jgi:hypothetical protein